VLLAVAILLVALSYLASEFYSYLCQATGFGGAVKNSSSHVSAGRFSSIDVSATREVRIRFAASVTDSLEWTFKPMQSEIKVLPGETVLASYEVTNLSDRPVVGVSSYNVTPMKAGQYFVKIQCFCFEQQKLAPHETVELPVFFYIDPAFLTDPNLRGVDRITLSYTFFKSAEDAALATLPSAAAV
jgi:cytochrome c oxidase assembly protein subunit 11